MHLVPKLRSWARRLVVGVVVLAAFYPLAANLFLFPSVGPSLISRRPERFRIGWRSAWSVWPGEVHYKGLEIRGRQPRVRWWITAEQGTARIDLAALLRREVRVESLRARGVRSQTDRVLAGPVPPPAPRPARRRPPWKVRLRHVELAGVRELGYGPLLLQGDGRIDGSFQIVLGREVELGDTVLVMPAGRLLLRGGDLAREVDVHADLRLGPYAPRRHRGIAGFDFLTGHLTATGKVPQLRILERIDPAGAAPVHPGTLAVDLRLEQGRLGAGSRLRFAAPEGARLAVSGTVEEGRLALAADSRGITLRRRDGTPLLTAAEARLTAASAELRLSRLISGARTLRRAQGSPLIGIMETAGLRLRTGGRTVSAEVTADKARGQLDLAALFARRVVLDDLLAEGAAVRIERGEQRPPAVPAEERRPWTVEIGRARIDRLREARSGAVRLAGSGHAEGSLSWNGSELAVRDAVLELRRGRVWRGAEELARGLDLRLAGGLAPCGLGRQAAALDCATFGVRAVAQVHRLRPCRRSGRAASCGRTCGSSGACCGRGASSSWVPRAALRSSPRSKGERSPGWLPRSATWCSVEGGGLPSCAPPRCGRA